MSNQIELRLVVPPGTSVFEPVLQYRERLPMYPTGEWGPWQTVPVVKL